MRWFKHMTATRRDERIASLIDEHGFEGYGIFWAVLEIIAEQMPRGEARYEVRYSLKRWGQLLGCHHNKVKKYLSLLGVHGLVWVEWTEDLIIVSAPNLTKYRDEYSKKSGHCPEKLRTVSPSDTELETEIEINAGASVVCREKILGPDGLRYVPCGQLIAPDQSRPYCGTHLLSRQRRVDQLENGRAS